MPSPLVLALLWHRHEQQPTRVQDAGCLPGDAYRPLVHMRLELRGPASRPPSLLRSAAELRGPQDHPQGSITRGDSQNSLKPIRVMENPSEVMGPAKGPRLKSVKGEPRRHRYRVVSTVLSCWARQHPCVTACIEWRQTGSLRRPESWCEFCH